MISYARGLGILIQGAEGTDCKPRQGTTISGRRFRVFMGASRQLGSSQMPRNFRILTIVCSLTESMLLIYRETSTSVVVPKTRFKINSVVDSEVGGGGGGGARA